MEQQNKSKNITWQSGEVSRAQRYRNMQQSGATLWLTGLSGAGKSTLAFHLEQRLLQMGLKSYVLDGDNIRHGLSSNLGFAPEDRTENIRRVGEVCRLMADAGLIVLSSFISPFREDRHRVRAAHQTAGLAFVEIFVDTPLALCEQRDPKGLYGKARRGEIRDLTGIDSPYEVPEAPELTLTPEGSPLDNCDRVIGLLWQHGIISA
jgi:adenylyl-sulfate kinase